MFGDPVVEDTTLVREAIASPDYEAGVAGWSINEDGTAEFNDLSMRGALRVGEVGAAGSVYLGPAATPPGDFATDEGVLRGLGLDAGMVYRYGAGSRLIVQGLTYNADGSGATLTTYLVGAGGILGRPIELRADSVAGTAFLNLGQGCADVTVQGRSILPISLGRLASSESRASTSAIGTTAGTVVTLARVELQPDRAYEIKVGGSIFGSAVDVLAIRQIMAATTGAPFLVHDLAAVRLPTGGSSIDATTTRYVSRAAAASPLAVTFSLTLRASTGTVTYFASANSPRWMSITEVGEASKYPEAIPL